MLRCLGICRSSALLALLAISAVLPCNRAAATTYTWTGNGNSLLFNVAGNWLGGLPIAGSNTDLTFAGTTNTGTLLSPLNINLGSPFLMDRMTFSAGAGSFFIGGNALKMDGANSGFTQNSASAQNIMNDINGPNTNGTVTLTLDGNGTGLMTLGGNINKSSGARDYSIVKNGSSMYSLTGSASTYSGGTTINAGGLVVNSNTSLGAIGGALTINAGTLRVSNSFLNSRLISLGDATSTFDIDLGQTFTASAVISGPGTLNKNGSGTMVLSGTNTNTYTGGTKVNAGTLQLGAADRLLDSGAFTVAGGTFNLNGFNETVGAFSLTSGSVTGAGTLTASSYTVSSGTIDSVLAGIGGLVKSGSGTVTLNGINTYTGGTTINGGTLVVSPNVLGPNSSGLTINAGTLEVATGFAVSRAITLGSASSTVQVDLNQTYTVSSAIAGAGTLNKNGTGTMILNGANSFTGGTNVQAGTLQLGAAQRLFDSGALTVSGGIFNLSTFDELVGNVTLSSGSITGSGTLTSSTSAFGLQSGTVSAVLGGSGAITKTTSGTVVLSNANTFTSATAVNAGTLQVNANNALGTTAAGTSVSSGAALALNAVNYSTAEALSINGTGISNGGALVNSGTSTFAGHITAATNATINAGGGVLNLTGGLTKDGTTLTIAGGGRVNISGQGIDGSSPNSDLVVDNTTVVLSAANSYNGPTTVQNSGTIQLGASNVMPTAPQTALTVNTSSNFDLASYSDSVASLSGDNTATVKNSVVSTTSTLTVNPATGTSTTFAGVIAGTNSGAQGNVALAKSGAGTLTLTGANTFSGSTTVSGGTLTAAATSGNALGSTSGITVNSGAKLLLGASNQINNTAQLILAGGTFAAGGFSEGTASTVGAGTLTLATAGSHLDFGTGTVSLLDFAGFTPAGSTLLIDNWSGTAGSAGTSLTDRLIFNSDQTANLLYLSFVGFNDGTTQIDLGNGFYEVVPITPVPESGTVVCGLGLIALLAFRERRRVSAWLSR